MRYKKSILISVLAITTSMLAFSAAWYLYPFVNKRLSRSMVFSESAMISNLWREYKKNYIDLQTGRTIDKQRGNITTSEGQAYTMLRAVWMDDKETFDKAWVWTKENLQRDSDSLFAWLYEYDAAGGLDPNLLAGRENSASDADTDIALALLFASARWQEESYLQDAYDIINGIWDKEIILIKGRPYLASNSVEKEVQSDSFLANPSYFAPYAYKIFAQVDFGHNWEGVIDTSYEVLQKSIDDPLGKSDSSGLPPDWIRINKRTGESEQAQQLSSDYSFDAIRIPWRIALDWVWFADFRAKKILDQMGFLREQWAKQGVLYASYSHDGKPLISSESPAMYGGSIGYFMVSAPEFADDVYKKKLEFMYNSDFSSWRVKLSYYDDNLAWFGLALYNGFLPNLWEDIQYNKKTALSSYSLLFLGQ